MKSEKITNWLKKMPAETKRLWVNALRSGDYAQTRETLNNKTGFCCLGVLLDVQVPELWVKSKYTYCDAKGIEYTDEVGHKRVDSATIPAKLQEQLGMRLTECNYLMEMNDEDGCTFDEIAYAIENEGSYPESWLDRQETDEYGEPI